jgi:transcriptional regulator with XRE-family HTH domain
MTGLGEIIQVKRKELGLTQERLAEKNRENRWIHRPN